MTDIKGERLQIIDGIRGLSFAGMLMVNMHIFQYGSRKKDEIQLYSLSNERQLVAGFFHFKGGILWSSSQILNGKRKRRTEGF